MSYPLYKQTTRHRSCTLHPRQLDDILFGYYTGIEVYTHVADEDNSGEVPELIRFVTREEVVAKLARGEVTGWTEQRDRRRGKFRVARDGEPVVYYSLRW